MNGPPGCPIVSIWRRPTGLDHTRLPRRSSIGLVAALLVLGLVLDAAAATTDPPPDGRSGWSLELAGGWAAGKLADNTFRIVDEQDRIPRLRPREGGLLVRAAAVNRLTPGLDAGLEVTAWSRSLDDAPGAAHLDMLLLVPVVSWHPGGGGAFLRLGYGLGITRVVYQQRGTVRAGHDHGPAVLIAAGWGVSLGERWTVVPRCGYSGFAGGGMDVWASLLSVSCALAHRF